MPIAKTSILVAKARKRSVLSDVISYVWHASGFVFASDSLIILAPIYINNPKASQWSQPAIKLCSFIPPNQPAVSAIRLTAQKAAATLNIYAAPHLLPRHPEAAATAILSIERLKEMIITSNMLIPI